MRVIIFFLFFMSSCATLADKDYDELREKLGVDRDDDKVILICSCKKPAFIIDKEGVWIFYSEDYTSHINDLVLKSCNNEGELPNTDTYDTGVTNNHVCPLDL